MPGCLSRAMVECGELASLPAMSLGASLIEAGRQSLRQKRRCVAASPPKKNFVCFR